MTFRNNDIKAVALLFLLTTVLFPLLLQASPLVLEKSAGHELAGHLHTLEDSSKKLDFAHILSPEGQRAFHQLPENLNKGYSHSAFWITFSLQGTSRFPDVAWLRLTPSYIDSLTIYVQQPNTDPSLPSSYWCIRKNEDEQEKASILKNPDFTIPVKLSQDSPVHLYARVFSMSSISLAGKVHTHEDLREHTARKVITQSVYLGIGLVICIMNLIFFIWLRDKLFLYFSIYALTVLLNSLAVEGMVPLLVPSNATIISFYLVRIGIGAQVLVFSLFAFKLFRNTANRWSLYYMMLMAMTGLVTMIAVPGGFYTNIMPFTFLSSLLLIIILLWESKRMLAEFRQTAILMFLAFTFSAIGYIYQILKLLGYIPLGPIWDVNTIQPATLIHMMLITMALSERMRLLESQLGESHRFAEKRGMEIAEEMTAELLENKERLEISLATEHKSVERQNRFMTMLSHEYRTPLAIIQGSLDIIETKNEQKGITPYSEMERIRRAIKRLVDVMDISLEQSRLMDPRIEQKLKEINAAEFVTQQVDAARLFWHKRNFNLVMDLSEELIYGDLPLLNTVLFNLLENAQKYSPLKSRIDIVATTSSNNIIFAITNTVEGRIDDNTEVLFEKYYRGSGSHNTSGAGIGLWLVRHIIDQHNGSVTIQKEHGSKITIRLKLPMEVSTG